MNNLIAILFSLVLLCAIAITLYRVLYGSSLADRVIAFDLIAALLIAKLVIWSVSLDNVFLLEIAVAIALVGFLATVALARYLELRER